jgi:alpha-1,2-glucosyltransferase
MQIMYLWPAMLFFCWPIVAKTLAGLSISSIWAEMPRLQLAVGNTFLCTVLINFFTIIHPFTLADNRHYVFYVFRYLNMHWATMYLVTPIYLMTSWLLFYTYMQNWLSSADSVKGTTTPQERMHRNAILFVWIGTSCLTLFGAALVEPRYFILPFVIFRLLIAVPLRREEETKKGSGKMTSVMQKPVLNDHLWLALETVWYLAVNVATGYVFLYRTFEWPQEPGLKQRFMW